jgi:hypothetical protein
MRWVQGLVLALLALPAPAAARDPILSLPVDCTLGETCYIQNYMDHDGGPGAADFTCGPLTYDDHSGTDIALPSLGAMAAGVAVRAAAPGTVTGLRDGMADIAFDAEGAPDVTGKECGNGVVVDHGGGWETQYCHLKQGSIAVRKGQKVGKATLLGQVGLSGQTQFPHLHLSVRHDGARVDPFLPDGIVQCGLPPGPTLWQGPLAYVPGGLIAVGIADRVPDYGEVKAGGLDRPVLPGKAPALVVWGHAFGARAGDELTLRLEGPAGVVVHQTVDIDKTQAQVYRAVGQRSPGGWAAGEYTGTVTLRRDGAVLDEGRVTVRVEN